jgi:hypothetical protein
MSMPGFTAEQSLQPSIASYHGGGSYALHDDQRVEPEILGVIKEAFESAFHGFSSGIVDAAKALNSIIVSAQNGGGGNGQPLVCGQWATRMIACNGNSPAYSEAEILGACAGVNPFQMAACAAVSVGMYPLVQKACAENPGQVGDLVGQVCGNY